MTQKFLSYTLRFLLIVSLFLLVNTQAGGQQISFSKEIAFATYLQDKELFKEATYILGKIDMSPLTEKQRDTLYYLSGWGAYMNKQLDTAVGYLLKVSPTYPLYLKSRFFAAYSLAYQAKTDSSQSIISALSLTDSVEKEMQSFQLAGLALLRRDYQKFERLKGRFTYSYYAFQKEEQHLATYHKKLSRYRSKSPLLAGIYSTLLPGAGKYYAGKKKQGIASFLPIASLGLVAYEAYRKGGAGSARFIAFGSLFSVFYVGNIWGSVLAVKIKQKEFYREYDNKILFDMHIPLRNLYN